MEHTVITASPLDIPVGLSLPAPRLQLRWVEAEPNNDGFDWACHYELVLPLRKHDIRREVYDDDGVMTGKVSELVAPLDGPSRRGGGGTPCEARDGTRYFDPPFRDGAHAKWDSEALGGLPIYVIAPDGTAFAQPNTK